MLIRKDGDYLVPRVARFSPVYVMRKSVRSDWCSHVSCFYIAERFQSYASYKLMQRGFYSHAD